MSHTPEHIDAKEAKRRARFDADEPELVRGEKLTIGIKMENDTGCLYHEPGHHPGVRKASKKQKHGEEAPDEIELTRGQLAMLSRKHAYCTPSVQCLADVLAARPSDEEEDAADKHVAKLRREQRQRDRHERRKG